MPLQLLPAIDVRNTWQHGDQVIDIIGFSHGVALVVHFANILGQEGIKLNDGSVVKPEIRFLGVWNFVGSFDIPIERPLHHAHSLTLP